MKVNGDLVIVEGGKIVNLTLPDGSTFPGNGNIGELFSLHGHADQTNFPDGLYHNTGAAWKNIATLDQVKSLINGGGSTAVFRPILRISTIVGAQGLGKYWAIPNLTVADMSSALTTVPLNLIYLDPADFPVGAKLRISATYSQNNNGTVNADFTIGLRKVNKPSATTGGNGTQMIYAAESTDTASVTISGGIGSKAFGRLQSAEFDIPVAGFYTFAISLANTNTNAATHWDLVLQAKY